MSYTSELVSRLEQEEIKQQRKAEKAWEEKRIQEGDEANDLRQLIHDVVAVIEENL